MMMDVKKCKDCRYYRSVHNEPEWVCVNGESELFGEKVNETDGCIDYEAPDKKPNIR